METENLREEIMKILTLISTCLSITVFSGCLTEKKAELQTATIKVGSMVCGSCAETIKAAVINVEGIENVDVRVETKTAMVRFLPLKTNLKVIETAIVNAGYDANDTKRNPEAYEKLDACCKIDG